MPDRVAAILSLTWLLAFIAAFVYCLVIWQPAVAVGCLIAALAPAVFDTERTP